MKTQFDDLWWKIKRRYLSSSYNHIRTLTNFVAQLFFVLFLFWWMNLFSFMCPKYTWVFVQRKKKYFYTYNKNETRIHCTIDLRVNFIRFPCRCDDGQHFFFGTVWNFSCLFYIFLIHVFISIVILTKSNSIDYNIVRCFARC